MSDSFTLLTLRNAQDPGNIMTFEVEGDRRTFGRDASCDVTVTPLNDDWTTPDQPKVSRVAGVIWRMDDQLWVRNLSRHHELHLDSEREPRPTELRRRVEDGDPGAACSIPLGRASLRGPDNLELWVEQHQVTRRFLEPRLTEVTCRPLPLPSEDARTTAQALCRPILAGGLMPASHGEIALAHGKQASQIHWARVRVEQLMERYHEFVPELQERAERRNARSIDAPDIVGRAGTVAQMRRRERGHTGSTSARGLPDSYELAHFLVRSGLVS